MGYKNILLALSLDSNAYQLLIKKAQELMGEKGIALYLVHAVEHMSGYGFTYGVSLDHQIVKISPAKFLILNQAGSLEVDLILLGSRGRHGIQLLLGPQPMLFYMVRNVMLLVVRLKE